MEEARRRRGRMTDTMANREEKKGRGGWVGGWVLERRIERLELRTAIDFGA